VFSIGLVGPAES